MVFLSYWLVVGSIFNFIYYFFNLDFFVNKTTLKNIDDLLENKSFLSKDNIDQLESLREQVISYKRETSLFTITRDLINYPLIFLFLILSAVDCIIDRLNKK